MSICQDNLTLLSSNGIGDAIVPTGEKYSLAPTPAKAEQAVEDCCSGWVQDPPQHLKIRMPLTETHPCILYCVKVADAP